MVLNPTICALNNEFTLPLQEFCLVGQGRDHLRLVCHKQVISDSLYLYFIHFDVSSVFFL
jgi:hypothetical protein